MVRAREAEARVTEPGATASESTGSLSADLGSGRLRIHRLADKARLVLRSIGRPCGLEEHDPNRKTRPVVLGEGTFGLGIGALGADYWACRGRLGEFVAACGALACLPTGNDTTPRSVVSRQQAPPPLQVLHSLVLEGEPSHALSFGAHAGRSVTLSELAMQGLKATHGGLAGMVAVAETEGLVGAALRRSPALTEEEHKPLGYPGIRDWLELSPGRLCRGGVALVVGVMARAPVAKLSSAVRRLSATEWPQGHFHAAAFPYRSVREGPDEMVSGVRALFRGEGLKGVLHLLYDGRDVSGAGESRFVRGMCWVGAVDHVVAE